MKKLAVIFTSLLLVSSCSTFQGKSCSGKKQCARKDTNGDGKISKKEWRAMYLAKFKKKDTNGDGFISKDEMKKCSGKSCKK